MGLLMADMKADEMGRWKVESMVYWMVGWWAVGMDKKMAGMMA
jgi:hypothetical protein